MDNLLFCCRPRLFQSMSREIRCAIVSFMRDYTGTLLSYQKEHWGYTYDDHKQHTCANGKLYFQEQHYLFILIEHQMVNIVAFNLRKRILYFLFSIKRSLKCSHVWS